MPRPGCGASAAPSVMGRTNGRTVRPKKPSRTIRAAAVSRSRVGSLCMREAYIPMGEVYVHLLVSGTARHSQPSQGAAPSDMLVRRRGLGNSSRTSHAAGPS